MVIVLGCASVAAQAQTAPQYAPDADNAAQVEDIVVTSRRVEERLQTTGASVSAFSQETLDQLGVRSLTDLRTLAPNVVIDAKSGNASQGLTIKIRGIGVSIVDYLYTDPSVGLYIDGVFQPRAFGPQFDLFDLDRVEVLRGPQGTLYGKNSLGGAINIVTRKPDAAAGAQLQSTIGNFGTLRFQTRANGPIVDGKLYASVAFASNQHEGYYRNTYQGALDPADENRQAARLALRWTPSDIITVDVSSQYTRQRQHAPAFRLIAASPTGLTATAITAAGFQVSDFNVGPASAASRLAAAPLDYGAGQGSFLPPGAGADGRSLDNATFKDQTLAIQAELSPSVTVKSTSGYHDFSRFLVQDLDGTPAAVSDQIKSDGGHSFTSDLQLNARLFSDRLDLVAGIFGIDEHSSENQANDFLLQLAANNIALRAASTRSIRTFDNSALAGYGHLIFHVSDRFRLTAGLRYGWERKEDHEVDSSLTSGAVSADATARRSWRSTTPQFGAEYELSNSVFTYANIAKGYASGGFSNYLAAIHAIQQYDPESLWSYEVGVKSTLFDKHLLFNASAFYMDYSNIVVQSFIQLPSSALANAYNNGGGAHVKGVDAELQYRPSSVFSVTAGLGLLDQKFTQFGLGAGGVQIPASSAHFFDSPSVTANVTALYKLPLGPALGAMTIEGGWAYRSKVFFDNSASAISQQPGFSLFNAQLTYDVAATNLSLSAFINNIADKVYLTRTVNALTSPFAFGLGLFGPPRTYGVTLRYKIK